MNVRESYSLALEQGALFSFLPQSQSADDDDRDDDDDVLISGGVDDGFRVDGGHGHHINTAVIGMISHTTLCPERRHID